VLFLAAFLAVGIDVLRRGRTLEAHGRLPLEPETKHAEDAQ
jgi:hypothetical protein